MVKNDESFHAEAFTAVERTRRTTCRDFRAFGNTSHRRVARNNPLLFTGFPHLQWENEGAVLDSLRRRRRSKGGRGQSASWTLLHMMDDTDNDENTNSNNSNDKCESRFSSNENESDGNKKLDQEKKKRLTMARVGGRTNTLFRRKNDNNHNNTGILAGFIDFAAPIFAIIVVLRVLLGGLFGGAGGGSDTNPGYVYYQSSVYESRIIGSDGRVETARKESVRSNIPSLVTGAAEQTKKKDVISPSSSMIKLGRDDDNSGRTADSNRGQNSFLLEDFPDEEFDRELNDVMKLSRTILDDFF